ncbi:hypothetical protein [Niveibacterium microcysteis]|uniref:Uncharacterized protein n=1 Tax=Niveibacterium microcysteis TaxID=2811415 RepID=A0ABX7M6M1_9RHOO|nr:hypothetical protein [Niveibacterium microcysteis]QSI77405.1 hypothetical protein JY500_01745 [Niveibacterium microcysteis]
MDTRSTKATHDEDPIGDARFSSERPTLFGDVGFDAAYATESHPEGLRYGEKPRAPGVEPHRAKADPAQDADGHGVISVG